MANIVIAYHLLQEEQKQHIQSMGAAYADALIKPLWDCDDPAAQAIIDSMVHPEIINAVRLHNVCTDHTLISGKFSKENIQPYIIQLVYDDASGHNFNVGKLEIEFSPIDYLQNTIELIYQSLLIISFTILCLIAVALSNFHRLIIYPLQLFQKSIDSHTSSRNNPALVANLNSNNNELSRVIRAYDKLIETVTRQEAELKQQARIDPLTGLGNRLQLAESLNAALARAKRYGGQGYVMLIDLDGFKPINDTFGHAAGDFVLQVTAKRLLHSVRGDDTVIRLGGDEFVLLIEAHTPPIDVEKIIERILALLTEPLIYEGNSMAVKASIGVSSFSGHEKAEDILNQADQLMYTKKYKKTK